MDLFIWQTISENWFSIEQIKFLQYMQINMNSRRTHIGCNILNTEPRVKANVEICHMSDGSPTCFAVQIPNIILWRTNKTHLYYFNGRCLNSVRPSSGNSHFIWQWTGITRWIYILAVLSKRSFSIAHVSNRVWAVRSVTAWFHASKSKEGWQIGRACRCSVLLKLNRSIRTLIIVASVQNCVPVVLYSEIAGMSWTFLLSSR